MSSVVKSEPRAAFVEVDVLEAARRCRDGEAVILDVREADEHRRRRIPGVASVPLSTFDPAEIDGLVGSQKVILQCESGRRSRSALELLHAAGRTDAVNLAGGLKEWVARDLSVEGDLVTGLPMMRQVQIAAGIAVLGFTILAAAVDSWFLLGTGFVGAGLCFAGLTGTCGLAVVLGKLPWNRPNPGRPSSSGTVPQVE
ncbi:MAG: rhodanese-like domain-containing protein [Phycisphaerales bacterium]|nr:rhodanese-like domain-containing protein [Phycisphaerales bacterium]